MVHSNESCLYDRIVVDLTEAVNRVRAASELSPLSDEAVAESITPAVRSEHGDYASNISFRMAKELKKKPADIATLVAEAWHGDALADAVAPGFVNFSLSKESLVQHLRTVSKQEWCSFDHGKGHRVNLEYVSANPTGPLHVGHGRGAVIGDVTARLLANTGYDVDREYYLNDVGNQVYQLGVTLLCLARRAAGEDDGGYKVIYGGDYMNDLAEEYVRENLPRDADHDSESISTATTFASRLLFDSILSVLKRLDIEFDTIKSEASIHPRLPALIERYRGLDLLYEAEQAEGEEDSKRRDDSKAAEHQDKMEGGTFLRTSRYGDETDRVILRRSGDPTYFTADIAYHLDKFERGYDRLINFWGADHGGHVKRLRAALTPLEVDVDKLEFILCQMVRLIRGGEEIKMSKRSGKMIMLSELIDEVGGDAVRFFFLMRTPNSQCDFDLDLAVSKSADNPVFYCQYAHARSCQLINRGKEEGIEPSDANLDLLTDETELNLLRMLARLPEAVRRAAMRTEPHRLTEMSMELAQTFHRYQTAGKETDSLRVVRPADPATSAARLYLVRNCGAAMKKLLNLMGVNAPVQM